MDHLKLRQDDSSISRRSFLRSASAGLFSSVVLGSFSKDLLNEEARDTLIFLPDDEQGFFSLRIGDTRLIERAFWRIESEEGAMNSTGGRYKVTKQASALRFADLHGVCDVEIRWRSEEEGTLLAFTYTLLNISGKDLRIKNFFPMLAVPETKGGFYFRQTEQGARVLTDEWERCYGGAAMFGGALHEKIESAWDVHLFDPSSSFNCTLSYYQVPNTKLSFTLARTNGGSSLAVRCDTHAGTRGVRVRSGKSFTVSEFMVRVHRGSCFDALESYARLIARRNKVQPPSLIPTGWVDWYFAKAQTTEDDVLQNLDFIANELRDFGLEYVQIDSGWQVGVETSPPPHNVIAGGPWEPNSRFPRGMRWFADEIRKRGLKPGIWVRPFQCVDGASERKEHPDWFNEKGQMDFSHPGVHEYVRRLFTMLTTEWGYEYVKYDFPSFDLFGEWGPKLFDDHAARTDLHNPEETNIEAYRQALTVISEAARGKSRLLACNSVMAPTLGLADVFRIGDDVGDWDRTLRYGVKSISARYYTNGVFWTNDPDCLLVRDPFTVDQSRMWASLISLSGGAVFVSEYLPKLPSGRVDILKKTLPVYRNAADGHAFGRPIDALEHDPPELWHFPISRPFSTWHVVGLFNWSETQSTKELLFPSLGLDESSSYHLVDFWSSKYLGTHQKGYSVGLAPLSCQVLSIHKDADQPQVLSTTRHVLQGAVELLDMGWDPRQGVLSGRSSVIKSNPYEIVLFTGKRRVNQVTNAEHVPSTEPRVARLRLSSDRTKEVRWTVELKGL